MSVGSINSNSLFNNPTLLGQMLPGINVQGMQQALQSELYLTEAPLGQLSSQIQTLSNQSSAWSQVASQVGSLLQSAQSLQLPSTFAAATTATQASGSAYFSVTGGADAPAGAYNVTVNNVETNQSTISNQQTSQATALGLSGSLTLTFGTQSQTVNVGTGDSLQSIATNINTAAAKLTGVTAGATVVPSSVGGVNGYTLALTANGTLGVSSGVTGLSFTTPTAYQAGSYSLNGVTNTVNSNTVQNAVNGVTLNLLAAGSGSFNVTNDTATMSNDLQGLINGLISVINLIQTDTGKGAVLEGNPTLLALQNQLMSVMQKAVPGLSANMNTLADLGLTIATTTTPATTPGTSPQVSLALSLNSATLNTALSANWSGVQNLVTGTGGIAGQLASVLQSYNGTTGIIGTQQSALQNQEQTLTNQESLVQQMVNQQQQTLQAEFNNLISMMLQSSQQSGYLTSMINSLGGSSSNSGKTGG